MSWLRTLTARPNRRARRAAKLSPLRAVERLESRDVFTVSTNLVGIGVWTPQGPGPALNGQVEGMAAQGSPVSGAVQAIAPVPNTNTVFVGTTNGGVWKTTNVTATTPTWLPLTDQMPSLSIGDVAVSADGNTVVVGTGRFTNGGNVGQSVGMYRSVNGGTTWVHQGEAELGGRSVASVVLSGESVRGTAVGQHVGIAVLDRATGPDSIGGLFETTDGGSTWHRTPNTGNKLPTAAATDVIEVPGDLTADGAGNKTPRYFYAAVPGQGVFKSTDFASWQSNGALNAGGSQRIRLSASGRGRDSVVYAGQIDGTGKLSALHTTTDEGTSWAAIALPTTQETDNKGVVRTVGLHDGGQGVKNFSMAADPANPNVLFVGGDRQAEIPGAGGTKDFTGRIFRYDGSTWTQVVGTAANGTSPHADSRDMAFVGGTLYESDDGGLYRLTTPGTSARAWSSANGNLSAPEVNSVAYDYLNNVFFLGAQDNGHMEQVVPNSPASPWTAAVVDAIVGTPAPGRLTFFGGDGDSQAFTVDGLTGRAVHLGVGNNLESAYRRDFNSSGKQVDLVTDPHLDGLDQLGERLFRSGLVGGDVDDPLYFNRPMVVNAADPSRVVVAGYNIYESTNYGRTVQAIPDPAGVLGFNIFDAVAAGAPGQPQVLYAAMSSRIAVRDAGDSKLAAPFDRTFDLPAGETVRDIVIDPLDWRTAYVVTSRNVFKVVDAGRAVNGAPAFVRLTGDLANQSADLWTVELFSPGTAAGQVLLAGGASGVFAVGNPAAAVNPTWAEVGLDLPNAVVKDVRYDPNDSVLYAGTYGRGVWAVFNPTFGGVSGILTVTGDAAADAVTLRLDTNGDRIEVVSGGVTKSFPLANVREVRVELGAGNDTLTLDATNGLPGRQSLSTDAFVKFTESAGNGTDTLAFTNFGSRVAVSKTAGVYTLRASDGTTSPVTITNIETLPQAPPDVALNTPVLIGHGLEHLLRAAANLRVTPHVAAEVAGLTLLAALDGTRNDPDGRPTGLAAATLSAPRSLAAIFQGGSSLVRRVLDDAGFRLSELGTSITNPDQLETRLLGLPGTKAATVNEAADGSVAVTFTIARTLSGEGRLTRGSEDGLAFLDGLARVTADVELNLRFGVDAAGNFYLDPVVGELPEITIRNINGTLRGDARLGFLELTVPSGTFQFDPQAKLEVNLTDPSADGKLTLPELADWTPANVTAAFLSGPDDATPDLKVSATVNVTLFNFTPLNGAKIDFTWQDFSQPAQFTFTPAPVNPGPAQKLLDFIQVHAADVASAVEGVAAGIQQATGTDILATEIPVVGKTLGDVLAAVAKPSDLPAASVLGLTVDAVAGTFRVAVADLDLGAAGVALGRTVTFLVNAAEVTGNVEAVDENSFTVRPATAGQFPAATATAFKISRPGGLGDQIRSFFGGLDLSVPTLQELIRRLGAKVGVDLTSLVTVKDSPAGQYIEIPLNFTPAPLVFDQNLSFDQNLPFLDLTANTAFQLTVAPQFHLTLGVGLAKGLAPADRFFLVPDAANEVQFDVSAVVDNPTVSGRVGFVDVTLSETGTGNGGIQFTGSFGVNVVDPQAVTDKRVTLTELAGNGTKSFAVSAKGALDIDGLVVRAGVGTGGHLGQITISLEGSSPTGGLIDEVSDLTALPGRLLNNIQGEENFFDLSNISGVDIAAALIALAKELGTLIGADAFNRDLPLVNRSVNDLISFADGFVSKIGDAQAIGATNPLQLASLETVRTFLQSKLGSPVTVAVDPDAVRFGFTFTGAKSQTLPLDLSLGNGFSFASFDSAGSLQVGATAGMNLTLGFGTKATDAQGKPINLLDRVFLDVAGPDATKFDVTVSANSGYTIGTTTPAPLQFTAGVGPVNVGVIDGRVLVRGSLNGLVNDLPGSTDGKLTLAEIGTAATTGQLGKLITGTLGGDVQAFLPIDGNNSKSVDVTPTTIPAGSGDALVRIAGKLENLTNIKTDTAPFAASAPNVPLSAGQLDGSRFLVHIANANGLIENGLLGFNNLVEGVSTLLGYADKLLDIDLLDAKLPIVNKSIRDGLNFVSGQPGSLTDVLTAVQAGVGPTLTNLAVQEVATAIRGQLGKLAGVAPVGDADGDGVVETNGDDYLRIDRAGTPTATVIRGTATTTADPLVFTVGAADRNFKTTGVVVGDVVRWDGGGTGTVAAVTDTLLTVKRDTAAPAPPTAAGSAFTVDVRAITGATFLVRYTKELTKPLGFDLGLDFLPLKATGGVNTTVALDAWLGFGISLKDGFFVKTDFSDIPKTDWKSSTPTIGAVATLRADQNLTVSLGGVSFVAGFATSPASVSATLGISLLGTNGKLPVTTLLGALANPASVATLGFTVASSVDTPLTLAAGQGLPSLSANLIFKVDADGSVNLAAGEKFAPVVALNQVTLNAGAFVDSLVRPVLEKLQVLSPLAPIVELIREPLPLLNKSLYTVLRDRLVEKGNTGGVKALDFLVKVADFIQNAAKLGSDGAGLSVSFGNISLVGVASGGPSAGAVAASGNPNTALATTVAAPSGVDPAATGTAPGGTTPTAGIPGSGLPVIGNFLKDLGEVGITFPVLQIGSLVKLLTGQVTDLVFVNLPALTIDPQFDSPNIPLFNFGIPCVADINITASFSGHFDLTLNLSAGLDTRGLTLPDKNFLAGFYVGDFDPGANGVIDPTDPDRPELTLEAGLGLRVHAGVRLFGLPAGSIDGTGTIGGTLEVDLNDDNENSYPENPNDHAVPAGDTRTPQERSDGKLYLDEFGTIVDSRLGEVRALFDFVGTVTAGLNLTLDALGGVFHKEYDFSWVLAEFESVLRPVPPVSGVIDLADVGLVNLGGTLRQSLILSYNSSTTDNDRRRFAATEHAGGDNVQILLLDRNDNPTDGVPQAVAPKNGYTVTPITVGGETHLVIGKAGAGFAAQGVQVGQRVKYFTTTVAGTFARFGTVTAVTADTFTLDRDTTSTLDPAKDVIVLSGRETIRVKKTTSIEDFGPNETGDHFLADAASIQAVVIDGGNSFGAGNDILTVDPLLSAFVSLSGGAGNDTLSGARGGDVLSGGDGDDELTGGPGNDTLLGGAGNDGLAGGDGNDSLVGETGNDAIDGGADNDTAFGDAAVAGGGAGTGGSDTIAGGDGNDTLFGGNAGDVIFGNDGDDSIRGEGGRDLLYGGAGRDTLLSGLDNDTVNGGLGNDFLSVAQADGQGTGTVGSGIDYFFGYGEADPPAVPDPNAPGVDDDLMDARNMATGGTGIYYDGGFGHDTIRGSDGDDVVEGSDGGSDLLGANGEDLIIGSINNDRIIAEYGRIDDIVVNLDGIDIATDGGDRILGLGGNDLIVNGSGEIVGGTISGAATTPGVRPGVLDLSDVTAGLNFDLDVTTPQAVQHRGVAGTVTSGGPLDNVIGGAFADTFVVKPQTTRPRSVAGGGQPTGTRDTLTLNALGAAVTIRPDELLVDGFAPINAYGFEAYSLTNTSGAVTVVGTGGADVLRLFLTGGVLTYDLNGVVVSLPGVTSLTIQSGGGADQLVLDFSGGNPIPSGGLTFQSGAKVPLGDVVVLKGTGSQTGTQSVAAVGTGTSTVAVGGRTLSVVGRAGVQVLDFAQYTLSVPVEFDAVSVGPARLDGANGFAVAADVIPLAGFARVAAVTLDLGAGTSDGADAVTVADGAVPAGTSLTILTGNGADVLTVAAGSGAFTWNAGAGIDRLVGVGDTNFTLSDSRLAMTGSTVDLVGLAGESVELTGGASANTFTLSNFSGQATLDGAAGTDSLSGSLDGGRVTSLDPLSLAGNLLTQPSPTTARLEGSYVVGTTRTVTVSDGSAVEDLVIDATLTGAGGLTFAGAGLRVLRGTASYSGPTTLAADAGSLQLDATLTASALTQAGGTLTGSGATKALVVNADASLSPGGTGVARLTANGGLTLNSGANLAMNLNGTVPATGFDQLTVTGAVSLGGAVFLPTATSFTSTVGTVYRLIDNDGTDAVTGTLIGPRVTLATGGSIQLTYSEGTELTLGGKKFRLSYVGGTGNDLTLTHVNTNSALRPRAVVGAAAGEPVFVTGNPIDPDDGDDFRLTADWGDGSPLEFFVFPPGTTEIRVPHRYTRAGEYAVALKWTDQHGGGNADTLRAVVTRPTGGLYAAAVVPPQVSGGATLPVRTPDGATRYTLPAFDPNFAGPVSVAVGDLTGDGIDDVVRGAGQGGGPRVQVFDGATGSLLADFFAYDPSFRGGVNVAVGNLDADPELELVTGAGSGGGPHVGRFDLVNGTLVDRGGFFGYDPAFRGGVRVAGGDIDGDGLAEIVAGAGVGGGPHVRVFGADDRVVDEFFAYDPGFRGGVNVAADDGLLVAAAGPGGGPHVRLFQGVERAEVGGFFAGDPAGSTGAVASLVRLSDGVPAVVAGPPGGGWRVFTPTGTARPDDDLLFGPEELLGVGV